MNEHASVLIFFCWQQGSSEQKYYDIIILYENSNK